MTPTADRLPPLATRPLSQALLQHALLSSSAPQALQALQAQLAPARLDEMEREIGHVMAASGQDLASCLRDLEAFNALTPETENDAWYEQPAAFTSMHLDALLPGFAQRRLLRLRDQLLAHARPARRALEVGSGSGHLAALLVDAEPAWEWLLVDRSAAAVRFASAYHEVRGSAHRVRCRVGDLGDIPAPDAAFDLVVAAEVLEHAPDPQASTRELLRVLRPGGWLSISLPIDLDIAMHPTVFASQADILAFFGRFPLALIGAETVAPDPRTDAIAQVFPGFSGCVNALFQKRPPAEDAAGAAGA